MEKKVKTESRRLSEKEEARLLEEMDKKKEDEITPQELLEQSKRLKRMAVESANSMIGVKGGFENVHNPY